jgi:ABC-type glycerol-3-phosphate transport system permease component
MNLTAHLPTRRAGRDSLSVRGIGRTLAIVLAWLGGLLCIAPPLYTLGQSLVTQSRCRFSRPALLSYISVLQDDRLWNAFKNTAIGELIIIATTLFFCPLAGYGFAKFKFRGRNFLFSVMILTLFFVPLAQLIPLLLEMNAIGWLDTYQAMVAPLAISSLGIFWMVMVIRAVPDEILHAARLDGCGSFSTWWRIVLPLIKPSLPALGFVMFVTAYGDYLWPLLVLPSDSMQTVQLYLQGGGGSPAALVITSLPAIIAFFLMQHYYKPGSARLNEVPAAAEEDVFPFQAAVPTSVSAPAVRLDGAARTAAPIAPFRAAVLALVGLRPWLAVRTGRIVQCAIIVGWPCLVYLNALHKGFRLDDVYRVAGNPGVENLLPIHRYFTDPSTSAYLPSLAQFLHRANPLMAFCILAYWIAQSPESSVTPMLHNAVDYRPYPAQPFLFLILALLLNRYLKPVASTIVLLLLIVFFSAASVHMNAGWSA